FQRRGERPRPAPRCADRRRGRGLRPDRPDRASRTARPALRRASRSAGRTVGAGAHRQLLGPGGPARVRAGDHGDAPHALTGRGRCFRAASSAGRRDRRRVRAPRAPRFLPRPPTSPGRYHQVLRARVPSSWRPVDAPTYQTIKRLYLEARELSRAERGPFLDERCSGNDALRAEVEGLLTESDTLGEFMARPASGAVERDLDAEPA